MLQRELIIHTDGASKGNPGIGGWGAHLQWGEHVKEIYGGSKYATNNQMELTAVIEALKAIKRCVFIVLYTDSQYVKKGVTEWRHKWRKNGWRTSSNKPIKNLELWRELDELAQKFNIEWHWVKGHAINKGNIRADQLANMGCNKAYE